VDLGVREVFGGLLWCCGVVEGGVVERSLRNWRLALNAFLCWCGTANLHLEPGQKHLLA